MKRLLSIVSVFLIVMLCACSSQKWIEPVGGSLEMPLELNDSYVIDKDFLVDYKFSTPNSILVQNDILLITDLSNNCIEVFDLGGNHKKTIGSTGNGPLQFIAPSAITYKNGLYYIVDSKNLRIQILNEDFTYNSERELPEVPADMPYIDIAVDEERNAYITTFYTVHKYAHVYKVSETGLVTQIGEKLIGYIADYSDKIYMANTLEVLDGGARSGKNYIYNISDNNAEIVFEIPYLYMPEDFVATDEYFFFYSRARCTLDKFTLDGKYIETLFQFENNTDILYMSSDNDQSVFFLVEPVQGKIYCIRKT